MSWRAAFLRQARSENAVRHLLNRAEVESSHQLHYLQTVTEKLAKGLLADPDSRDPPATRHNAFVRLLQALKNQPQFRAALGYVDYASFVAAINLLMPLAREVEQFAPTHDVTRPNVEYPWRDRRSGQVVAPVDQPFAHLHPSTPRMAKLEVLVDRLLAIES